MMLARRILTGFSLLLVAAPIATTNALGAQARGTRRDPIVRDSAGVRIIEHATLKNAPVAFTLTTAPVFQLGGLKTNLEEEFNADHPFLAATRLSDRRIAVADRNSIKFFDANGKYLMLAGRKGPGPGEFTHLRRLCLMPGDTLLAIDYNDRRVSLWSRDGKLLQTFPATGVPASEPCFPDGTMLVEQAPGGTGEARVGRTMAHYARIRPNGTLVADLGLFPTEEYGPIMISPSVVATPNGVWFSDTKSWDIRRRSLTGKLTMIIRAQDAPVPITDADIRAEAERRIPKSEPPDERARRIAQMMGMPRAKSYPVHRVMLVDPAGRLWVQDYESMARWTLFAPDGSLAGTVTVPTFGRYHGRIHGFEPDTVIIEHPDDDGALRLSYYRLTPGAGSTPRR